MLSFRKLLKQTSLTISSPSFRQYLFLLYKRNNHVPLSSTLVSDWMILLKEITLQQAENKSKVTFTNKIHHYQFCGMGYKGFELNPTRLASTIDGGKLDELLDFFMFAQLEYIEWKLAKEREVERKQKQERKEKVFKKGKKQKSLMFAIKKEYHNVEFKAEFAQRSKEIQLEKYGVTLRAV